MFVRVSWKALNELPPDRYARRQDSPSLADIVVGVTAKAVVLSLGESVTASSFAKVEAYVQRVGEIAACAQAASGIGAFTEASTHELACRCHKAVGEEGRFHLSFLGYSQFSVSGVCNTSIHAGCNIWAHFSVRALFPNG